uniref:Uncharacterized protein n=1 Tax=Human herpesvirus 2 TaxID=10310 RepID=A0A481T6D9_HHV2|nr:hypothetical protein [Human alphaherpesvirus 2]
MGPGRAGGGLLGFGVRKARPVALSSSSGGSPSPAPSNSSGPPRCSGGGGAGEPGGASAGPCGCVFGSVGGVRAVPRVPGVAVVAATETLAAEGPGAVAGGEAVRGESAVGAAEAPTGPGVAGPGGVVWGPGVVGRGVAWVDVGGGVVGAGVVGGVFAAEALLVFVCPAPGVAAAAGGGDDSTDAVAGGEATAVSSGVTATVAACVAISSGGVVVAGAVGSALGSTEGAMAVADTGRGVFSGADVGESEDASSVKAMRRRPVRGARTSGSTPSGSVRRARRNRGRGGKGAYGPSSRAPGAQWGGRTPTSSVGRAIRINVRPVIPTSRLWGAKATRGRSLGAAGVCGGRQRSRKRRPRNPGLGAEYHTGGTERHGRPAGTGGTHGPPSARAACGGAVRPGPSPPTSTHNRPTCSSPPSSIWYSNVSAARSQIGTSREAFTRAYRVGGPPPWYVYVYDPHVFGDGGSPPRHPPYCRRRMG